MYDSCEHRPAWSDEQERIRSLLGDPGNQIPTVSWSYVAVKPSPVERLVAVAECWEPDHELGTIRFRWTAVPGARRHPVVDEFLKRLIAEAVIRNGQALRTIGMFSRADWRAERLSAAGFRECSENELFVSDVATWRDRMLRLYDRAGGRIQELRDKGYRVERLTPGTIEAAWQLIDSHGLLAVYHFEALVGSRKLFEHSTILLSPSGQPVGIFLTVRQGLDLDVVAVAAAHDCELSHGLIFTMLMQAANWSVTRAGLNAVRFRADPTRNPATRRTGLRAGSTLTGTVHGFEVLLDSQAADASLSTGPSPEQNRSDLT